MNSSPHARPAEGALSFFHPAAGGLVLMAAALTALLMDNSPLSWLYSLFLDTPVGGASAPLTR
jgi:Na+/H+ antiporter NhaA